MIYNSIRHEIPTIAAHMAAIPFGILCCQSQKSIETRTKTSVTSAAMPLYQYPERIAYRSPSLPFVKNEEAKIRLLLSGIYISQRPIQLNIKTI